MAERCKANVDNIKFFKKGLKPLKAYGYMAYGVQPMAKHSYSIVQRRASQSCIPVKKLNKNALKNWFQRL